MDSFVFMNVELSLFDMLFFAIMIFGCVYSIYTALRLKRERCFFKNQLLLPGNCKAEKCKDSDGYFKYIIPKLYIFGALLFVCAAVQFAVTVSMRGEKHYIIAYWISVIPTLLLLVWFVRVGKRAEKLFWK